MNPLILQLNFNLLKMPFFQTQKVILNGFTLLGICEKFIEHFYYDFALIFLGTLLNFFY